MVDLIIVLVILAVVGCAGLYIYKAKKSGRTCIGCPNSKQCGNGCNCGCSHTNK